MTCHGRRQVTRMPKHDFLRIGVICLSLRSPGTTAALLAENWDSTLLTQIPLHRTLEPKKRIMGAKPARHVLNVPTLKFNEDGTHNRC